MRRRRSPASSLLSLAAPVALLFVHCAAAAPAGDAARLAEALGRAEILLRDASARTESLQAELAALRAAKLVLEQNVDALRAQAGEAERDAEAARRACAIEATRRERERHRAEALEARLAQRDAQVRRLSEDTARLDDERQTMSAALEASRRALGDAEQRNLALFRKNRALLESLRKKLGLAGLDWLTGLSRMDLENQLEVLEYESFDLLLDANLAAVRPAP